MGEQSTNVAGCVGEGMKAWNTTMDMYCDFPQRCYWFQQQIDHTPNAYAYEDGTPQTAFYCERYKGHRIVEEECLGLECDCCKLIGIEDFVRMEGDGRQDIQTARQ